MACAWLWNWCYSYCSLFMDHFLNLETRNPLSRKECKTTSSKDAIYPKTNNTCQSPHTSPVLISGGSFDNIWVVTSELATLTQFEKPARTAADERIFWPLLLWSFVLLKRKMLFTSIGGLHRSFLTELSACELIECEVADIATLHHAVQFIVDSDCSQ